MPTRRVLTSSRASLTIFLSSFMYYTWLRAPIESLDTMIYDDALQRLVLIIPLAFLPLLDSSLSTWFSHPALRQYSTEPQRLTYERVMCILAFTESFSLTTDTSTTREWSIMPVVDVSAQGACRTIACTNCQRSRIKVCHSSSDIIKSTVSLTSLPLRSVNDKLAHSLVRDVCIMD